jgi:RNA polymerase sigma factor (sigma-70 family)
MSQPLGDIFELIRACAAGDAPARRQFQDEYGEDIYYFPVKLHGLPLEKAGDFYVYVFDNDRVFTRLRTFAGLKNIQFRTFLSFFVLKSLFFDWLRTLKEVETVSFETRETDSTGKQGVSESSLPDPVPGETGQIALPEERLAPDLWNCLTPEEQLDLKLLCLIEGDLSLDDIRLLTTISGRPLRETLLLLEEVQQGLRRKDEKLTEFHNTLDSVWGWILLREKELQQIDEKIRLLMADREVLNSLVEQKQALEESLEKRYRQREKLVKEIRTYKLTTPYRDLARLLNTTVGTVCSRIFRLRKRLVDLVEEVEERRAGEERAS